MSISLKHNPGPLLYFLLILLTGLVFLGVSVFSLFYLFSSFEYLKNWFLDLNPCIYSASKWSDFFNPVTKSAGNAYCIAAVATSLAGLLFVSRKYIGTHKIEKKSFIIGPFDSQDILYAVLLILLQTFLWIWGQKLVVPSYDEVFSAVNCASVPVFQCLSYYMLPNNHIFFNLLNNILFHWAGDHIFTGRIISLFAYLTLVIWAYFWFAKQFNNRIFSFAAAIALAVQFPLWGFGFQARGYELYALAQWAAFVLLFGYIDYGGKKYLVLNSVFCILGYITIPSFLYYYVAQILFMILYQASQKRIDVSFWKYQVLTMLFVFYFYLPTLCFSGSGALLHNKYVSASNASPNEFFHEAIFLFRSYIEYCFSNSSLSPSLLSMAIFLLPLALLFFRKKWIGIFFLVQIISFIIMVFLMKKLPFHRNLVGQYSIILTIGIVALYRLIDKIKFQSIKWVFPVLMILLAVYFFRSGSPGVSNNLYFSDAKQDNATYVKYLDSLPKGVSIGCSDQSFYWYYLCRQRHISADQCPDGSETFIIKDKDEQFPLSLRNSDYTLMSRVRDCEVYKLNKK